MERFLYGEESREKRKEKKDTFYIILALNLNVIKFNCLLTINLYEIYSNTSKDLISIKLGRVPDNGAIKIRKNCNDQRCPQRGILELSGRKFSQGSTGKYTQWQNPQK